MEMSQTNFSQPFTIRRYLIQGSRTLSNFWWATIISFGGMGFILAGLSSFFHHQLLPFFDPQTIVFFPQGLVMMFYGLLGLLFGLYLSFTLFWRVGAGFNEFNKATNSVRIFRWGFPGKNRRIDLIYPISDIQTIQVDIQDGLTPKRALYLLIKERGRIPLLRVGAPCPVEEIEQQAAELARFLRVPLELNAR